MIPARFCKVSTEKIADIVNPNAHLEPPHFEGALAFIVNTIIDAAYRNFGHVEVNRSQSNFESFFHCGLSILKNDSDIALAYIAYPFAEDITELLPYEIFLNDQLVIISAYNMTHETRKTDILRDSIKIFQVDVWIATLIYVCMFGVLSNFFTWCISPNERNLSSFFEVLSRCIQKGSIEVSDWSRRLLFLVITIFSFYVLMYFGNYLQTNAVVAKKPQVINSYRDILQSEWNIDVYTMAVESNLVELETADPESELGMLAKRVTIMNEFSIKPFVKLLPDFKQGRAVFLMNRMGSDFGVSTTVKSGFLIREGDQSDQDCRVWRAIDPSARVWQYGLAIRTDFARNNLFGRHILRKMRTLTEIGIFKHITDKLDEGIDVTGQNFASSFVRKFTRKDLAIHEVAETSQTKLYTFFGLFAAFAYLLIVAHWILFFERSSRKKKVAVDQIRFRKLLKFASNSLRNLVRHLRDKRGQRARNMCKQSRIGVLERFKSRRMRHSV